MTAKRTVPNGYSSTSRREERQRKDAIAIVVSNGGHMTEHDPMAVAVLPKVVQKRKHSFDWSALAFVASLCVFAFLYGFASNEFNLPPKRLHEAGRLVA